MENLRKQVVENQKSNALEKYDRFSDLMDIYKDSEIMIRKIKEERTVAVQKDVFDLAMKKITTQAEMEMLDHELKELTEHYAAEIDLNELGLDFQ